MELFEQMVGRGFTFMCGPHSAGEGLTGFYAVFIPPRHPECEECEYPLLDWSDSGHGHSFHEAVDQAIDIAFGNPITKHPTSAFRK